MQQNDQPYGLITDGCIVINKDEIVWVGPQAEIPDQYSDAPVKDYGDRLITPALIDCHTHLVYSGDRSGEFEMRLEGATYEEVARAGGGIVSTVKATRVASEDELLESALKRLDMLLADGVGTVEVKSGYGLDTQTELTMLRVARRLGKERPVHVKTTFLGAHALPLEYQGRADEYIELVCNEMLPAAASEGLVDAVDGFCEGIGFSRDQIERVFVAARDLNLPVKLHAEQLSNLGGAALAAGFGALSADHLEYLDQAGVDAMAESGSVAVLLPGAFYTLGETQLPPVGELHKAGVPIAIATDFNPGSSPLSSLLLAMNMACTLFRLTPEQSLAGVTRNAAKALGMGEGCGTIHSGMRADIAVWDVKSPAKLSYVMGHRPLYARIHGGEYV
ncbi:MAG: imidazolonepropionase [Rhizobiaceae bacterium]|nr:imidazolonepropionase [Rhizobiaceae bacterium]